MKEGLGDVLPDSSLRKLQAEDVRLLLCGVAEISITLLQSYTSFADESSASSEQLVSAPSPSCYQAQ